jgi:hypothetical protein
MEITVREILNASGAITALAKQKIKNPKTVYWLSIAPRKLADSIEAYEKTRNQMLIEQATSEGNTFTFPDVPSRQAFDKSLEVILSDIEEININPIKFATLLADPSLEITPEQITALGPLVDMGEEPE